MPAKSHVTPPAVTVTKTVTGVATPTAPATPSSPVATPTTPPVVDIPAVPAGYTPVKLADYRGYHPRTAQLNAAPNAAREIASGATYASTFGPAMPAAATFATVLNDADGWTELRLELEAFLEYVKSEEAVAWKAALTQMEKARAVYVVVAASNPQVAVQFPFLARLMDAASVAVRKGATTRKENAKSKAVKAPGAGLGAAAVSPAAATSGSGGAAH